MINPSGYLVTIPQDHGKAFQARENDLTVTTLGPPTSIPQRASSIASLSLPISRCSPRILVSPASPLTQSFLPLLPNSTSPLIQSSRLRVMRDCFISCRGLGLLPLYLPVPGCSPCALVLPAVPLCRRTRPRCLLPFLHMRALPLVVIQVRFIDCFVSRCC